MKNEIIIIYYYFPFLPTQEKEDTLLIKAARLGKEDVLLLLLDAGAAIEATNKVSPFRRTELNWLQGFGYILRFL